MDLKLWFPINTHIFLSRIRKSVAYHYIKKKIEWFTRVWPEAEWGVRLHLWFYDVEIPVGSGLPPMLTLLSSLPPPVPIDLPQPWWRAGGLAPWPWPPWSSAHSAPSKFAKRRVRRGNWRPSCGSHASHFLGASTKRWLSTQPTVANGQELRRCGTRSPVSMGSRLKCGQSIQEPGRRGSILLAPQAHVLLVDHSSSDAS
jgi:hypothetical protein